MTSLRMPRSRRSAFDPVWSSSLGPHQIYAVTKVVEVVSVKAVDDYVLGVVIAIIAQPMPGPPADSLNEMGNRVTQLVAEHPDVVDYFGCALIDGSPLGVMIFDTLVGNGTARWHQRSERGETRPDVDLTWAAINSLVLALGTLILRTHVERHLPEPLATPAQLERWEAAVNTLLRNGLFRR